MAAPALSTCPRCRAEIAATAATCARCGAWLIDWTGGRMAGQPPGKSPGPQPPTLTRPTAAPGRWRTLRAAIDTPTTLAALRLIVAIGMAVHGLAVITRLAEDPLPLLGWLALWLPLDAYWRAYRRPRN